MDQDLSSISNIITQEMEIDGESDYRDSEEMVAAIATRVEELLNEDSGLLFSYLYRLDVSEHKVRSIMIDQSIEDKIRALAELIWERQMLRYQTKKTIKQKPIKGWDW